MTFAVRVLQVNGHFEASLVSNAYVRGEGSTREAAIAACREKLERPAGTSATDAAEEIVQIDVPNADPMRALIGIWRDDPTVEDMLRDIYRARDECRIAEHGE